MVTDQPLTQKVFPDSPPSDSSPEGTAVSKSATASLGKQEFRRRIIHSLPGFLPFLLWPIPHRDPISPTLYGVCLLLGVLIAAGILHQYHRIRRSGESDTSATSSVLGYACSVIGVLLLFPGQLELAFGVLAVLAFGDGAATLGGSLLRGPVLPWNQSKTWAGLCSFGIVGIPMTSLIYWGESNNLEAATEGVSIGIALACTSPAVMVSALAESLPMKLNDNIRVGLTAAISLVIMHGLLVGWAG